MADVWDIERMDAIMFVGGSEDESEDCVDDDWQKESSSSESVADNEKTTLEKELEATLIEARKLQRQGSKQYGQKRERPPSNTSLPWEYHDGGRRDAGFSGFAGDCFTRAVAIAAQRPYQEVYDFVNMVAKDLKAGHTTCSKQKRAVQKGQANRRWTLGDAHRGVRNPLFHEVMRLMGWVWTPTMHYGGGCKVHLRPGELPPGRLICRVTKHLTAVVDGVIYDSHDPCRHGNRCVYGYFSRGEHASDAPLATLRCKEALVAGHQPKDVKGAAPRCVRKRRSSRQRRPSSAATSRMPTHTPLGEGPAFAHSVAPRSGDKGPLRRPRKKQTAAVPTPLIFGDDDDSDAEIRQRCRVKRARA
mmetsp:Transcript_18138/g.42391  ORF Transcript_18138/g.42391 Transcript_18138/m.42391 type:complete len:359 (-) Transcript_18138:113-1189(-)|eukprot:CAMPEP_0178419950 /NCGR_PEP_ID=MMETSP0689_2-20121128/25878_1 /TAXON_ID=160604 /ORGANISM="Amphidinium massartii, Strain CS-259" /LENGTH=358 /DNA_ID=CAMNT_0020041411 /DNA_START=90 /DNA_END=1166 /DNA_ORIENTATION=-